MRLVDLFLVRSDIIKMLIKKFKDHKSATQKSFQKVKEDNKKLAQIIAENKADISKLKNKIKELEEPLKIQISRKK